MTKTDIALKYRFSVEYEDGSVFEQSEEDKSMKDPLRSAFYDIDQERVATFSLTNMETGKTHGVSLIDGHFEINGQPFFAHDLDLNLQRKRLIFFRRHLHQFNPATGLETGHTITYRFGWQALDENGKNHQIIITID